jgi:hypothetical protein
MWVNTFALLVPFAWLCSVPCGCCCMSLVCSGLHNLHVLGSDYNF